jgi:uncharacterized membrane protein YbhN (UPF0104 family)
VLQLGEMAAEPAQDAAPPAPGRGWAWWLNWIAFGLGTVGVGWILGEIGYAAVGELIGAAGVTLAAALALDLGANLLRARAIHRLLRPYQRMVRYPRVVIAQLAGAAMHDVTPTGVLGEPTKLTMLLGRVPATAAVSAIVAYDVLSLVLAALVTLVGLVVVAASGLVPEPVARALWATAGLQIALLVGVLWLVRRGPTATTLGLLGRVRALSAETRARWHERAVQLDLRIREVSERPLGERVAALTLLVAARGLVWGEFYLLLRAVGVDPGPGLFAALVLGQIPVGRLASVIPLGMGLSDLGMAALFALLGQPAEAGALLVLLRRLRQVTSAGLGLSAMLGVQTADRVGQARAAERVRARAGP